MFKLNMHQMDAQAISHLLAALKPDADAVSSPIDIDILRDVLRGMADRFGYWDKTLGPKLEAHRENKAVSFLIDQLAMLRQDLKSAGFSCEQIDQLVKSLESDSPEAHELQNLTQEFAWRSRDIMHELQRRWPAIESDADPAAELLRDWLKRAELPEMLSQP